MRGIGGKNERTMLPLPKGISLPTRNFRPLGENRQATLANTDSLQSFRGPGQRRPRHMHGQQVRKVCRVHRMATAKAAEKKGRGDRMTYDPSKWFFTDPVRPEPKPKASQPFMYQRRSHMDLARRVGQSYKGVPDTARRDAADSLCVRCGVDRANHGRKKNAPNPFRACARFVSPYARARKVTMQPNSEQEQ